MYNGQQRKWRSGITEGTPYFYKKHDAGFTLVEIIVTIMIVGLLAAVATPVYNTLRTQAKVASTTADLEAVKKAFVNHYYSSMLTNYREYPPVPSDSLMTQIWASETLLNNGEDVSSLFSEREIPLNPNKKPYQYYLLSENSGFVLKDSDYAVTLTYEH